MKNQSLRHSKCLTYIEKSELKSFSKINDNNKTHIRIKSSPNECNTTLISNPIKLRIAYNDPEALCEITGKIKTKNNNTYLNGSKFQENNSLLGSSNSLSVESNSKKS
eukprot:jgi/Orpsp1_1/1188289/evm.model.d7180000063658.1